jgi:hypothetical protein
MFVFQTANGMSEGGIDNDKLCCELHRDRVVDGQSGQRAIMQTWERLV